MVRKIATQVPASVSRLIQSTLISRPPAWYGPALANPAPILPPRQTIARSRPGPNKSAYGDLPPIREDARREGKTRTHHVKHYREPKPRPLPIMYEVDRVRRQFFSDFPFEALRPVSLVEAEEVRANHAVTGKAWTSLAQRGAYPTVEDTIQFTLNLHETAGLSVTDAYAKATAEFVKLRAAHEMATLAAAAEARSYGAIFKRDEWDRAYDLEERRLDRAAEIEYSSVTNTSATRTKFKYRKPTWWMQNVNPATVPRGEFTGGREYLEKWRLPAAVATGFEGAAGDLVSAIGTGAAAPAGAAQRQGQPKSEDEMDDLEFLQSVLATPEASASS